MPPLIHGFDPPERFVTGTVGPPGQRTFFLQARSGARITSVSVEKQQVAVLAERIDQLLDEVMAHASTEALIPAVAPLGLDDAEPLEQPIEEEFRAGTMTLSWDPDDERVVIEVFPFNEAAVVTPDQLDEDHEEPEPEEVFLVRIDPGIARAFVKRAEQVIEAGRPTCPFCGNPIDPEGHLCVRANGFPATGPVSGAQPEGDLELHGRIMPATNATYLGEIYGVRVVYKPIAGERPLWDFPEGTLADREVAAYLVSEAMGWDVVPQTWLRDGPHGPGMAQRWREPDPDQSAVDLVPAGEVPPGWKHVFDGVDSYDRDVSLIHEDTPPLRRMAIFDVLVNNADRKGGHVLEMAGGHRYGVDHGVTFHVEPKLRTVLWGWLGEHLTEEEVAAVRAIGAAVCGDLGDRLSPHLTEPEIDALERRCHRLADRGTMPAPRGSYPAIPWPPF